MIYTYQTTITVTVIMADEGEMSPTPSATKVWCWVRFFVDWQSGRVA